jgi:Protein of unknown function (DUF3307)
MNNPFILFTEQQGVLLIQLILGQLISDFLLQTDAMVKNKRWFSGYMLLHIAIVFAATALLTGFWKLAIAVAVLHWLVDSLKIELDRRNITTQSVLFIGDQLLHVILTVLLWALYFDLANPLIKGAMLPLVSYKISLMMLGYAIAIWPVSYLIKYATQNMVKGSRASDEDGKDGAIAKDDKIEHGGRRIGQFERTIILTFVLLQQYEAIGFLITGKSIIRFAQRDENLRSEYVLVGTMMSYAFSILIGVLINWLLDLNA